MPYLKNMVFVLNYGFWVTPKDTNTIPNEKITRPIICFIDNNIE